VRENSLSVLMVSPSETGGGAEMVAADLFTACRRRGIRVWMAVGAKSTDDPDVIELPNDRCRSAWARFWLKLANAVGKPKIRNFGEPKRWFDRYRGREDMEFPASRRLLEAVPGPVGIVHAHNLHGAGTGFFDLRALPPLTDRVPVILTLHDAWLLAGHCAHSFDCDRWERGCGRCPYLSVPEMIRRDASAENHAFKAGVFDRCSLHVATPSTWLMDRAQRSLLAPAMTSARVIPNGIDLGCFHPGDRSSERRRLGLDERDLVVLSVGNTLRKNIWRDFDSAVAAVKQTAGALTGRTVLLGLGDTDEGVTEDNFQLRYLPHRDDPSKVAALFRAADIYLHSSRADTFPTVVLEAMACGLPVVASAVGGVPEQVIDGETGFLVRSGDVAEMTRRIKQLIDDRALARRFGSAAARRAVCHFDRSQMVDSYVAWYHELIDTAATPG